MFVSILSTYFHAAFNLKPNEAKCPDKGPTIRIQGTLTKRWLVGIPNRDIVKLSSVTVVTLLNYIIL